MIFSNLMVQDVSRSAEFYTSVLGMTVSFFVDKDFNTQMTPEGDIILASLEWDGSQLMLQRADSLGEELPEMQGRSPTLTGTLYFRGAPVDDVLSRLSEDQIVKQPFTQWYGMRELYFKDPDGYVICAGEMLDAAA